MKPRFEVEVKVLLGDKARADALVADMRRRDPRLEELGTHEQLNHYFVGGDLSRLLSAATPYIPPAQAAEALELIPRAADFSLRTRLADGQLLLVLKISADQEGSANGVTRREWEAPVSGLDMPALDGLLLSLGFRYQSKWSRVRTGYKFLGIDVTVDKNAGYGYVAEFELGVDDEAGLAEARETIRRTLGELGLEEISKERLGRMFEFYNAHWPEYYGTDKVFVIE